MSELSPATLLDLLLRHDAGRTAVVVPEQGLRVSYAELLSQVESVAASFSAAGIGRGDRIGIALPNGLEALVCLLAASVVGTAAPLNPAYTEDEFRFYLDDTSARVLVLPGEGADEARRAAGDRMVLLARADASGRVELVGAGARGPIAAPAPDDVALVLHTSGSTGRPKRVPLTHANLSISARNVAATYALGADDVSLCTMPLFHVHGLVASTLATLASGGTVVVPSKASLLTFWAVVRDHGVTWSSAVPTFHQLLLARTKPGERPPPGAEQIRFLRSCSASLAPQVMRDLEAAFGVPVVEAYGMTEAAHQMASNPLPPGERKPGSVGRGTGVAIRIVDSEGRALPTGQHGEVVIRGPNVMRGYENTSEVNAAAFVDGWFRTGDRGYLDADGYLVLAGRLKEMINRGGEKISPREIDEVLMAHPSVAEAVCFGVPHATWGEEVAAAVVLREAATEAELMAHCRRHLADFKRPKRIHITDTIPRGATGKLQRRLVAKAFTENGS